MLWEGNITKVKLLKYKWIMHKALKKFSFAMQIYCAAMEMYNLPYSFSSFNKQLIWVT